MGPPLQLLRSALLECSRKKDLRYARRLQCLIAGHGFESLSPWGSSLVHLFALCGRLPDAIQAFQRVSRPDLNSWKFLIEEHVKVSEFEKAVELFNLMQTGREEPDRPTFFFILKSCSSFGCWAHGMQLHDIVIRCGLNDDVVVSNTLIDMYSKCFCINEARLVFDKLPKRTVVSWGAMMRGYLYNELAYDALLLHMKMQEENFKPNSIILSCILKASSSVGALVRGMVIHHLGISHGLELDIRVQTALIDMYSACSSLGEAHGIFDGIKCKDIKSWGAIISAYAKNDDYHSTFKLFEEMKQEGLEPDRVIYMCVLKACQSTGSAREGKLIHEDIIKNGFENHTTICNVLIDMYVTSSSIYDARNLFDRIPSRDIISWSSMIAGYVQHESYVDALCLFGSMLQTSLEPDKITYLLALKPCGTLRLLHNGRFIHDQLLRRGFDTDIMVGSSLIEMYGAGGSLKEAHTVFNRLPERNVTSYGAIISGSIQQGYDTLSLNLFKKMLLDGIQPDEALCTSLLITCAKLRKINTGRLIHGQLKHISPNLDPNTARALMLMYSKCGYVSEASKVFNHLPVKTLQCWSAMISGYIDCGHIDLAFVLLEQMHEGGIDPDETIYANICKAYGSIKAVGHGRLVHDMIIRSGLECCLLIGSVLIDMYARCSSLKESHCVFERLRSPDVVCWGALISGYAQHNYNAVVLDLYTDMLDAGLNPDRVPLLSTLKACTGSQNIEQGRLLHQQVVECDLQDDNIIVSALVCMYSNCEELKDASSLLDEVKTLDTVQSGAMISNYVQLGQDLQALELFKAMRDKEIEPGVATLLCAMKACNNIGALEWAKYIHDELVKCDLHTDVVVSNTLIDMYAKCGSPEDAYKVFNGMLNRDVVSWSTMIVATASHQNWEKAFELVKSMESSGIKPDDSLFISILSACSHNGLFHEGCESLMQMSKQYGLTPRTEHYNCIVDVIGRGGYLNEAEDVVKTMPFTPNNVGWKSLLTVSGLYGDKDISKTYFDEIKQLNIGEDG